MAFENTDLFEINSSIQITGSELTEHTAPFHNLTDYYYILDTFKSSFPNSKIHFMLQLNIDGVMHLSIIYKP